MIFQRIEIINGELAVAACNQEDIPRKLIGCMPLEHVTVLYWYERDWLVLNKENANYEFYKDTLIDYLQMTNHQRGMVTSYAKERGITFFDFVNKALRIRRKHYQVLKRKVA